MTAKIVGAVWFLLSLTSGSPDELELPKATRDHGAFALADPEGARLLALADLPQPQELKTALCVGGTRLPARFVHRREEKENNGRQNAYNFDKLPGYVFSLTGGQPDSISTCFLGNDSLLSSAKVLPVKSATGPGKCTPANRRHFSELRGRQVAHCWPVGDVSPETGLVLVQFAHQGKSALASLILVDRGRSLFADYPAEYHKGDDVWRVGDGGTLSPVGFQIVFLLQRSDSSHVLGVSWQAEEGESLTVFESGPGDSLTPVIKDYWYQAPW